MKKLKNLVIGGIESKVVTLILISMLLVAGVFIASMLTQSSMLAQLTQETNEKQLSSVTETTTGVIDTVIRENMDRITDLEGMMTDSMFQSVAVRVRLVGDYAGKLLADPDSAPRMPWQRPDAGHDGELFVKALLAPGVEAIKATVREKIELFGSANKA